ncbi:MAG: alpha/beta fold hydrolase [Anaerolineae bacterium]|nr:alpha/beta fold hydrolase [Anaerolineae bacterium]
MKKQAGLPRDPRNRYRFKNPTFDFFFQWLTGTQTNNGAELGESMYIASQIKDGDPESWYREFMAMGERVEERAKASLANGHIISARESYLRCYVYYRGAAAFLNPRSDIRYRQAYGKGRDCFRKGNQLLDLPMEEVYVPFEGKMLPGYFARVDGNRNTKRRTLFMIGGGDTFVEDLYYYIVPAALRRNYNVLCVDLPGQGSLPWEGLYWRADMETPVKAVVDYALAHFPEIDPDRMAIYGISGGGYIVPRAVTREKRFKACVACSVILNFSQVWDSRIGSVEDALLFRIWRKLQPRRFDSILNILATYEWRWGAATINELVAKTQDHVVDPAQITCATLNLVAEQEYNGFGAGRRWAEECLAKITHSRKELIVAPRNEGGDSHGVGTNLSLMSQIVFDWLDDTLG